MRKEPRVLPYPPYFLVLLYTSICLFNGSPAWTQETGTHRPSVKEIGQILDQINETVEKDSEIAGTWIEKIFEENLLMLTTMKQSKQAYDQMLTDPSKSLLKKELTGKEAKNFEDMEETLEAIIPADNRAHPNI